MLTSSLRKFKYFQWIKWSVVVGLSSFADVFFLKLSTTIALNVFKGFLICIAWRKQLCKINYKPFFFNFSEKEEEKTFENWGLYLFISMAQLTLSWSTQEGNLYLAKSPNVKLAFLISYNYTTTSRSRQSVPNSWRWILGKYSGI